MNTMQFRLLGAYNRWANERLYAACAALPEAEYKAARPSFFGSIHRTLNHILVGDRGWLARGGGEGDWTLPLDTELYEDLESLRAARAAEDAHIVHLMEGLSEPALARTVRYRTSKGEAFENPIWLVYQHMFNHQTHHRGQVHDMLSQTAVPPPPLDLILFVREWTDQAALIGA